MTYQFGHEMGGFGGMYGWPYGGWTGAPTPIGATGQGAGIAGEPTMQTPWQAGQFPQMTPPFPPMGPAPWTGGFPGMGMAQPYAVPFGGFGLAPWHLFYQLEHFFRQHPYLHYGMHQFFGNLLLNAPPQHFAPSVSWGQFPWQQWAPGMGFAQLPSEQPFTGVGGGMGQPFPWLQQFGGFGAGLGRQFGARMTDEQITNAIYDCIEADPNIPAELDFNVECHDGVVTVTGACANKRIKHLIGEYCWWLPGVVDVNNQMRVVTRRPVTEQAARAGQTRAAQTGVATGAGTRG